MRLWVLFLGVACTKASPAPDSCTLETPLVADIPGSPGHLIASERNPNGASELATLMRQFVTDWQAARSALAAGQKSPRLSPSHRLMRCAWPTDPRDRNAAFDAMALTYLKQVSAFDERPTPQAYQSVIEACTACHEGTCPGPLAVIETLR